MAKYSVAVLVTACALVPPAGSCRKQKKKAHRTAHPPSVSARPVPPPVDVGRPAAPGPGFTFYVMADTHFGYEGIEPWNLRQVEAMNRLPGTAYPRRLGGRVKRPVGVLVAGDLTDRGRPEEFRQFERYFGRTGRNGLLRYPVFLATGNHDRKGGRDFVLRKVRSRRGSLVYAWTWHGVRFVSLDMYPSRRNVHWLRKELRSTGPAMPVVVFFHYSILGPFSQWWSRKEKERFGRALEGFNVVAVFHGHYHGEDHYRWAGLDIFNVGSPMFYYASFAVVRITARHLSVAFWNYEHGRWSYTHLKRLSKGPDPGLLPLRR